MRRLGFVAPGRLQWQDVPAPVIAAAGQAIIEPLVIGRCDLDMAFVTGLIPMKPGTPIGHEAIARVVEVGDGVRHVAPGDLVAVSAQIACGSLNSMASA